MKKFLKILSLITVFSLALNTFPVLAESSSVPECQFSGPPTADQLAACEKAAQAQSGAATGQSAIAPDNVITATPPTGQTVQNTTPTASGDGWVIRNNTCTYDSPNLTQAQLQPCLDKLKELNGGTMPTNTITSAANIPDLSQFGSIPGLVEGAPTPEFMGKALNGSGADQAAAPIGAALENIKEGLNSAEDGMNEMKEGGIKVDAAMEQIIKNVRAIYNEAANLYQLGDYAAAGQKLSELSKVGFDQKFQSYSEKYGVSLDLINDIRTKIKSALKEIEKIDDPESQLEAQADIMTQLGILDEVEKLLKAGKKKEAAALLKKMKKQSSGGQTEADIAAGKTNIPASYLAKILDKINDGLTKAGKGIEKMKAKGIESPAELTALIDKAKSLYDEAKLNFDKGNNAKASEIIRQIQDMKLKENSLAYRDTLLPKSRLKMILDEASNGLKALNLSITKAKEYGVDTTELEQLAVTLADLITKATDAYNNNDTELFLTIIDKADELNVRDKVDAAIRKVADGRAKEILSEGLTAANAAVESLTAGIAQLASLKAKTDNAKNILNDAKKLIAQAQAAYDKGEYMQGGRYLNNATALLMRLGNVLTDTGVKLSSGQAGVLNSLGKISTRPDDLVNTRAGDKAKVFFDNAQKGNALDIKQFLMQLNPGLMDKVISYREKDKKIIDEVIKEVIPLVPEKDQKEMLEGKINLLEEAKSADNTLALMKKNKSISKDTISQMQEINSQLKNVNFTTKYTDTLDIKMEELNNKIQSGSVKDVKEIANYVKIMKDEIKKDAAASQEQKYKANIVPARNITDTNSVYEEIKYLKDDGAVKPDKNGNINLGQRITGQVLTDMLNKTIDSKISNKIPKGQITVGQAAKSIIESYKVKPAINFNDPKQLAGFLSKMGADIKPADIKQKADLADVAEILAAADQRWGK